MMEQPRCCHVCGGDFAPGDTLTDQSKIGAMRCAALHVRKRLQNVSSLTPVCTRSFVYWAFALRPVHAPLGRCAFHSKRAFKLLNPLFPISRRSHTADGELTLRQRIAATTLRTATSWIQLLNAAIGLVRYVAEVDKIGLHKCPYSRSPERLWCRELLRSRRQNHAVCVPRQTLSRIGARPSGGRLEGF
jgi:hypothetical protein